MTRPVVPGCSLAIGMRPLLRTFDALSGIFHRPQSRPVLRRAIDLVRDLYSLLSFTSTVWALYGQVNNFRRFER